MASIILKASKSCANKNINTLLATSFHLLFLFYLTTCIGFNWDKISQHVASKECKTKVIRRTLACDADVKMSASDGKVIDYCHVFFNS